ncbi:3'-5' exonuclease [Labrys sp. La1]|uniref:3'-5' exonuclease n=1 Tax=Labrys sp. La1 TaxID=3404917 RepID=UPI003EBA8DB6
MGEQFDMFRTEALPERRAPSIRAKRAPPAPVPARQHEALDEATLVSMLEATGRYRIQRKLEPRSVVSWDKSRFPRLAVIVDTETTGLDHEKNEIIELGMVAVTYDPSGQVGDVVGIFNALRQPQEPIPPEITRLTGITDAMVAGKAISPAEVEAFIEPADLIIAHNARFDRPFCERFAPGFAPKPWACSNVEIAWSDRGFEGTKLGYLLGQSGYFHNGHRAVDDCHALLEVLALPSGESRTVPFAELLKASERARIRISAINSPFDMKERLKARGYRWNDGSNGQPKSWWTEVGEEEAEAELKFLRAEIYQWPEARPLTQRLAATDRFKA